MVFHACPVCSSLVPGESPGNKVILTSSPIKCLLVYEKMMLIPWVSKAGVENVWPTDLIRLLKCCGNSNGTHNSTNLIVRFQFFGDFVE